MSIQPTIHRALEHTNRPLVHRVPGKNRRGSGFFGVLCSFQPLSEVERGQQPLDIRNDWRDKMPIYDSTSIAVIALQMFANMANAQRVCAADRPCITQAYQKG